MSNDDLIWGMEKFAARLNAARFIKSFENHLCVFSGSVEQLFTSYLIDFPQHNPSNLLILPKPYHYYDTFNGIPEDAVKPTNIRIVRTAKDDGAVPMLRIPFPAGNKKYHDLPISTGLKFINSMYAAKAKQQGQGHSDLYIDAFLPVLVKGDLKEMTVNGSATPYLQVHKILLSKLESLSTFERKGIKDIIEQKLLNMR